MEKELLREAEMGSEVVEDCQDEDDGDVVVDNNKLPFGGAGKDNIEDLSK